MVTSGAEIIHQNDLLEEVRWRPVEHAVHGAEQRGPHFIHETENHTGGGQVVMDQILSTPAAKRKRNSARQSQQLERYNVQKETHISGLVSGMARSTGILSLR